MLAKTPIYLYNSLKFGPALGDFGKFVSVYTVKNEVKNLWMFQNI